MMKHRVRSGSRRSLAWGTSITIGAVTALALTGCSVSTAQAGVTAPARSTAVPTSTAVAAIPTSTSTTSTASPARTSTPPAASGTPSSAALEAMLQHAPVPALCHHTAGTLSGGRLPNQTGHAGTVALAWEVGQGRSSASLSSIGSLDTTGSYDVAAALYCDAGGVPWPEVVGVWRWAGGTTLHLVGVFAPETLSHNIVSFAGVTIVGRTVDISWTGPAPGKDDADGSEHSSAVLTLTNGQLVASRYHSTVA